MKSRVSLSCILTTFGLHSLHINRNTRIHHTLFYNNTENSVITINLLSILNFTLTVKVIKQALFNNNAHRKIHNFHFRELNLVIRSIYFNNIIK